MSSTNYGQNGQADGLNLQHFATSTDEDSLYGPTPADHGYAGFQRYPAYELNQQPLEDIRRSASPHLQTSTVPPPQHHSRQDYSNFSLQSSSTDPTLFEYEGKEGLTDGGINPADLMSSAYPAHSSQQNTPPLHIQSDPQQPSQPDSATFLPSGSTNPSGFEWETVYARRENTWGTHRKAPSEYSEISSAAGSPFLRNSEFSGHPSPLLQGNNLPQQGSMQEFLNSTQDFPSGDSFGLDHFSLNERDPSPHVSPRISPAPGQLNSGTNSPRMLPQENQYLTYVPPMSQGQGIGLMQPSHPSTGHGAGPGVDRSSPGEEGQFPQINVIFAPPQRQPTFPGKPGFAHDDGALSPPPKSELQFP